MGAVVGEQTISPVESETATFTKWMVGEGPDIAGVVGGAAGEGAYVGKVLNFNPGPTTVIAGPLPVQRFEAGLTALVHVEQTGLEAAITGVVTDGWGKGNLVTGNYTEIKCDHDGMTTDCWQGSLGIPKTR